MYVIGLTGNIAVGKSTVAAMLERLGAYVLDADELEAVIAHESAHAGHGDNLRLIVAQALFGPTIIMPTAHYYYRRLRRSIERAADLRALGEGGSAETLASALVTAARKLREFAPPADERGVRARLALKHREEFVAERAGRVLSARSEHRLTAGCLWLCGTVLVAVLAMHIAGENWLALLREVPHFAEASVRCLFESVLAALSGGT